MIFEKLKCLASNLLESVSWSTLEATTKKAEKAVAEDPLGEVGGFNHEHTTFRIGNRHDKC